MKLLTLESPIVGGFSFALYLKEKPKPKPEDEKVPTEEEVVLELEIDDTEKVDENPRKQIHPYFEEKLIPATKEETLAYYENLKDEDLVPDDCYWFYVENSDSSKYTPVYHFGIRQFFSGRVGFNWLKYGGVVYKVLHD